MATPARTLAWRILCTEKPVKLQSARSRKSWTRLKGLHTHATSTVAAARGECLKNTVLEKNTPWEGGHISANTERKS